MSNIVETFWSIKRANYSNQHCHAKHPNQKMKYCSRRKKKTSQLPCLLQREKKKKYHLWSCHHRSISTPNGLCNHESSSRNYLGRDIKNAWFNSNVAWDADARGIFHRIKKFHKFYVLSRDRGTANVFLAIYS